MKRNLLIERMNFEQCSTNGCSIDTLNYCMKRKAFVCNTCAAILHYDCDLKIKDEKGFIENSMELLKDLVQRMNSIEYVCTFNISQEELKAELDNIKDLVVKLGIKINSTPIVVANADNYVIETRDLLKQVLNSQVYKEYIKYNSRLKISREITRKLEEGDQENELRFINSQFYLKIKEREMESREKLVNSITQEFTQRITQMDDKIKKLEKGEKESDKKINEINNTIDKNAKSTARSLKDLKKSTNKSLNAISAKLNEEIKNNEELKEKQEKLNEKCLNKNKTDCEMLIEKSSKEAKENTLKLEKRVDKFEKKLIDIDEFVNEKKEKEKCKDMIKQLELKDDQYYINEFKSNKDFPARFKKAKEVYLKLGQYAYPHQFDSSRPLQIVRSTSTGIYNYIYFGQLKEGTNNKDGVGIEVDSLGYIFEGCWKSGQLNGFGRHIYKSGDYYIGEFKDGYIHGQGQGTCWWANGSKYVGEWKNSCRHGKGTEYAADGQISKEGVWENNVYVGKG